jgi:hypothetical protein
MVQARLLGTTSRVEAPLQEMVPPPEPRDGRQNDADRAAGDADGVERPRAIPDPSLLWPRAQGLAGPSARTRTGST